MFFARKQRERTLWPLSGALLMACALAPFFAGAGISASAPAPAKPIPSAKAANPYGLCCLRTKEVSMTYTAIRDSGCVVPPDAPCRRLIPKGCEIGPRARCAGADLSGLDLRFADLSEADLRGARLVGTDLENANLSGAQLERATLIGTDMADAHLWGTNLRGALILACDLESASLIFADLSGADVLGSDLESADLTGVNLGRASLRGSDLESADLTAANARGADFSGANLGRARLTDGRFDGANLMGTNLAAARLERTTFVGANLRRAHLGLRLVEAEEADDPRLTADPTHPCYPLGNCSKDAGGDEEVSDDTGVGALLVDTDLTGADLSNADLNGVVMLRGSLKMANLEGTYTKRALLVDVPVKGTVCPDGRMTNGRCAGLQIPAAGPERDQALARVTWLQSLPWPWD